MNLAARGQTLSELSRIQDGSFGRSACGYRSRAYVIHQTNDLRQDALLKTICKSGHVRLPATGGVAPQQHARAYLRVVRNAIRSLNSCRLIWLSSPSGMIET